MRTAVIDLLLTVGVEPLTILALLVVQLVTTALARFGALRSAWDRLRFDGLRWWRRVRVPMRRERARPAVEWPYGTFLQRLAPSVRAALLELGVRRRVPAGQIVIHEGVRESHLVLLEEGLTKVTATLPDGRTALLALRVGGDLVGEMSALNDRPRSATITTCGPTRYSVISPDHFKTFLARHPDAALELAAMVSDRLRWSNRRRIDFTSYPVKIRVARVIAELCRSHGRQDRHGIVIDVRLTQPELATICGAAETSVQKALRELRTDGLVETDYRRITVPDLASLARCGEVEPE
ncbi:Crp/Fnr family transcriptional regulator [Micromonospora halophytica]|uniref:cAMP-binding domain of CRP or a regulatory subunit of cAMP-dependent protein kinases n=1 Tax=Micromonospora halophytica TaxID=47864 RepID=A0A1C5J5E0_9ACTN|nr:Crp/Fnr family transcriptional regulator [Micromonospora halophytica]SCG65792.1 cAMP-binding domain of CRP or a regulatory subunit of cAMP-dependent protein kinases [Micromonospora halophytica]